MKTAPALARASTWTPRQWLLVCLGFACVWSLVMLVPVLSHKGWPANHDGIAPLHRMAAIAGQWRAGNLIPVWSTQQQFGYGSPLPGLYHKTFMVVSAAVFAVTGSVKAGFVLPLFACMVSAFCGMCFCVRQATGRRHPALWLLGGAALVASNYMTTNWLVRGAFAEISAVAVIPWIVGWCLILIDQGRWPVWIGGLMALLALSHSSVGLFCAVPLAIALAVAMARWRGAARRWWKPAIQSIGLVLLLIAPFALPMLALGRFNRIDQLTFSPIFTPRLNGMPWQRYLWDPYWTWGADWRGFTVQLDLWPLLLLPLYVGLLLWRPQKRADATVDPVDVDADSTRRDRWIGAFLLGTLAVMAWLQLPQAAGVYEQIPGAAYLQFAWRLLSYLTVLLILCACIVLSQLARLGVTPARSRLAIGFTTVLAIVLLVWTAEPKLGWHKLRYDWHPAQHFQDELPSGDYAAFGEFLPLAHWPPVAELFKTGTQAKGWLAALPDTTGCTVTSADGRTTVMSGERASGIWHIDCGGASVVPLPVFMAPGMRVAVRSAGTASWKAALPSRTCADPRLQVSVPAGRQEVEVRFPNWSRTVVDALSRPVFDYRRDCAAPIAPVVSARNPTAG